MQFPLTRITVGFVFGILFANYYAFTPKLSFGLLCFSFMLFACAFYWAKKQFQQNSFFGVTAYVISFCIGITTLTIHTARYQEDHFIHRIDVSETTHIAEVLLREKLKPTTYFNRYVALVKRIDGEPCSGKLLVNLHKDQFGDNFNIGSQLQITNKIILPGVPLNPDQFDYGKYLANKSILAQTYVAHSNVKISPIPIKDAFYYSDKLRSTILSNLKKSHFHDNELNVLAALILGQQQDISPELVEDYQYAGAVHILSVSGLHVGFIVLFLGFILQFLPNTKSVSHYKLGILLLSLWGFAVLAGLSPSVIRSVTMFSFVAVGIYLKRRTNIFHTLIVSLLLILLFEPSFLFDVGFHLSYMALFFILWIQPMFNTLWQPENKIVNYFWQILTVSFAAQIGTLPLSLYYFHQFSGLFFITNIIVIPFLSVIMGLGVLVMLWAAFNVVPAFLAVALEWMIYLLNKIIGGVASFESLVFQDIPLNGIMMFGLYSVIIAFVYCFRKFSYRSAVFVLFSILIFQAGYFSSRFKSRNRNEWIVFNVKKSTLIVEKNGESATVYTDRDLPKENPLKPFMTANFCSITKQKSIGNLAFFENNKILIIDSVGNYPTGVNPDVMVLRQSPKINLNRVFKTCRPKLVVADASNYKSYAALWQATCLKEKIPFHNTYEKGFFKLQN